MTPHPRRPVASEMHLPVPPTLHHQFLGSTSLGWRHLLRERNLELLLYSQNSKNGKFEKSLMLSRLRDKFLRSLAHDMADSWGSASLHPRHKSSTPSALKSTYLRPLSKSGSNGSGKPS